MQTPPLQPRPHPLSDSFRWTAATTEPRMLTAAQVAQYDRDGYVLVEDVIDLGTIEELRAAIDEHEEMTEQFLRQMPGETLLIAQAGKITFTIHLVERCEPARRFAHHPALVGICHDLVGDDVRLYWDQAVYKKPEPQREFPWHQDNGYAFVQPQQYLTCWVPLTDATIHNGCPWVLPGMHRSGTLEHVPTPVGLQCVHDPAGAVPVPARAGSVVVFSSLTPHRTGPNVTDAVRKSYIVQYAADGAEVVSQDGSRTPQVSPSRQFPVLTGGQPTLG